MNVENVKEPNGGYFKAEMDGRRAGLMSYVDAGADKFIIDHTEVEPAYAGKGVGTALVLAAVEYARLNGLKIIPICPFAKAVFMKRDDIGDVLFR
jgi:predicted GNAT family acetyltransferase